MVTIYVELVYYSSNFVSTVVNIVAQRGLLDLAACLLIETLLPLLPFMSSWYITQVILLFFF